MSLDGGQPLPLTTSPPLAAVPIQSQPPFSPPSEPPSSASVATASYQDVVLDENLFMVTLEALHRSIRTKFMVPRVGGKPLNLHRLFVEVTSRGGLQKVIRDRLWKAVISAFNFPSTITNASFVLRKYYISLLYHYEEVYFFRNSDLKIPTSGANHASPTKPAQLGITSAHGTSGNDLTDPPSGNVTSGLEVLIPQDPSKLSQLKNSVDLQQPGNAPLEIGSWVKGEIKGKFENGYLVTASYGSEKLTGILYHVPHDTSQSQVFPASSGHRNRKRSSQAMDESLLSKSNGSNLYADHCVKVNPPVSKEEKKISKQLGDLWNRLTQPSNEDNQETESEQE